MTDSIVEYKISRLRHASRKYINWLKAVLACLVTAFFSITSIISAQISIVENLPSRLNHPLEDLEIIFLFFVCASYTIIITLPIFLGFQLFSGITIASLILFLTFNSFIAYQFGLEKFGGAVFFLFIGSIIGWFSEIALAIGSIAVYSFWRNKGFFIVLLSCSSTIAILTTWLANIPTRLTDIPSKTGLDVVIVTCLSGIFILVISILIAKKALREDPNFTWLRSHAVALSAIGGISFNNLELKNQNFEDTDLSHVDFRGSKIYHTNFRGAKNLEFSCLQETILANPKVRKLLTMQKTVAIVEKNFRNIDLSGASLSGLELEGVDFTGANLTDVDFSNANLTGANFTNAQLFDANFSRACLNEVCICDWSINKETCFNKTKCNWIYLKQGKHGPLEKKPDIGEFQADEFEKWIRQLQDTIDLILREQPNVRALVAAIERVAHSHDGLDPSRFSIESKGDNLYIARVGTTPEADKEKVASTIIVNYNSINELMIQGESNRLLLNSAGGYMENQNQNINAGGNLDMSSGTRVSIGGDITGSSITLGDLNGHVSNTIQSIRDIKQGDKQNLAEILGALQSAINSDQALSESQKLQAMEAVSTLADESQKSKEERLPKICSMAMNALKGVTSTITDASKLADLLKTHLPTLVKLLGI